MLVQSTNLRPKWEMLQEVLGNPHRMLMGVGAIYENFLESIAVKGMKQKYHTIFPLEGRRGKWQYPNIIM